MNSDKIPKNLKVFLIISLFALFSVVSGQRNLTQFDDYTHYPFDHSDEYYLFNGVEASQLINRRDGQDKMSVFDLTSDPRKRGVRITATYPAYDRDGMLMFWNHYADVPETGFVMGRKGAKAETVANYYPVYMFPSEFEMGMARQAALIDIDKKYFETNPLGLGVVIFVEYSEFARTPKGQEMLSAIMKGKNLSADRTPLITTAKEIGVLTRAGLIIQTFRGSLLPTNPRYIVARVIEPDLRYTIAPDAFLIQTMGRKGLVLDSELFFLKTFMCIQQTGEPCAGN